MAEPLMFFLAVDDDDWRQVCQGCTTELFQLGMLRTVEERPMRVANADDGAYSLVVYEIVPPYTLLECRQMANQLGHRGPPEWGGLA